jgi:hypothetical protein
MTVPTDAKDQILSALEERQTRWSPLRTRLKEMDALVNDRWGVVFPNDIEGNDLPMVANDFKTHIEDVGHLFGAQVPNVRVDPESGFQRALDSAEKRERVLNGYVSYSDFWAAREYIGMDIVASGFGTVKVWPNMRAPLSERFPIYRRLDPRNVLPEPRWVPELPSDNVMVTYTETAARLKEQFPEPIGELMEAMENSRASVNSSYAMAGRLDQIKGKPTELRMVDWYSASYFGRLALFEDENGKKESRLLLTIDNPTGLCPVQVFPRSAWSLDPSGLMDSAKGIMRTKNRFFRIFLDYFTEMVYGGKIVWNIQDPFTKSGRYIANGPDARMDPVSPGQPAFQALQVLQLLSAEGAATSMEPPSRRGEVDLNKATAAFLTKAQGQLSSLVRSSQEQFATGMRRCNEAAFAMDEVWCNAQKTVSGRARGRRYRTTYTPKKDIAGDYANSVIYGAKGGTDPVTLNIMIRQARQAGDLSRQTALENDPLGIVEDVTDELAKIAQDAIDDGFLMSLRDPKMPYAAKVRARALFEARKGLGEVAQAIEPLLAPEPQPALPGAEGGGGVAPPGLPAEGPSLPPFELLQSLGR